ncbi:MAG TPA: DUF6585 family protein [Pirellulales bacterium]|nr:DUF6585 family protein [Pirellulales bacterium]
MSPEEQRALRAKLLAGVPDLGEFTETHVVTNVAPPIIWYCGAAFVLMFAGLVLYLSLSKPPGDKDRVVMFVLSGVFCVTSVGLAITGIVLRRFPKLTSSSQYVFCTAGVIHSRGEDVDLLRWSDLEIRKTCANPFNRRYELRGRDVGPVVLKAAPFRGKLIKGLQETQVHHIRPKLIETIRAGGKADFGRLAVNAQGLVNRAVVIPWDRIKALSFSYDQKKTQQLFLSVETRGERDLSFNASKELPNIWLFMELVSKLHPPLEEFKNSQNSWLM